MYSLHTIVPRGLQLICAADGKECESSPYGMAFRTETYTEGNTHRFLGRFAYWPLERSRIAQPFMRFCLDHSFLTQRLPNPSSPILAISRE